MTLADERVRSEGAAAVHGSIILAETQTGGIGRRGRSWLSPPTGNLYFSLLWAPLLATAASSSTAADPTVLLPHLSQLNLAASVAVVKAAAAAGIPTAQIKWPNDVWASVPSPSLPPSSPARVPKKMSGTILNFDGKEAAVLGVGINVLQDLAANETATSLTSLREQIVGPDVQPPPVTREDVLASFCNELERLMGLSAAAVLDEYRQHDLLRGRTIRVHHRTREEDDPRDFDAEALGVNADGMLRVRPTGGGPERALSGEEVSISPNLQEGQDGACETS